MDPELYKAAMKGNLEVLMQQKDKFEAQVTPNENSVLHIVTLFNNNSTLVKEILAVQPLILCKVNTKGETSLHIAAREGRNFAVRALIECAKEMGDVESGIGMVKKMLRMMNKDGNTALHEAVWNEHVNIVEMLVEEDPEFSHPANHAGETPLYIAAEKGFNRIMSKILNTCTSPTYSGPDGRTALHGAVIKDFPGCTTLLLEWKKSLTKESDKHGWTTLHYAAIGGLSSTVAKLLDADKSLAYLTTYEDNKMTPLHLAVIWGKIEVMEVLISQCPDCWEVVDNKGQNILHLASRNLNYDVIDFIRKDSRLSNLLNQKDDEGNTPLHVLAALGLKSYNFWVITFSVLDMIRDERVDKSALNNENLTPFDVANQKNSLWGLVDKNLAKGGARRGGSNLIKRQSDNREKWIKDQVERGKPIERDIRKMGDTQLIVAAFIATVTFAAGFTLPGGYDGDQGPNKGMAVLSRDAAFKTFVIFDTIAMIFSTLAVFLHFNAAFYKDREKIENRIIAASFFIVFAIGAMMVAFVTGLYAVLAHSIALAISVCSIVGYFSFVFFELLKTLFFDFIWLG